MASNNTKLLRYIVLSALGSYAHIRKNNNRGIEWSLRAFASTQALRIFLRAREVIKFVLRAVSTLENTTGEQQILR